MTCFSFPKTSCKELDMIIAGFWWGNNKKESGKIHWKRWDYLTVSKKEAGLGFRDFKDLNKALLAKAAWRLLTDPEDFWCRVLKGKYFPNEGFLETKKGRRASWCWSSILEGRDFLMSGLCWKIGDGSAVKAWKDKWIPRLPEAKLISRPGTDVDADMRVQELIERNRWNLSALDVEEKEGILKIPLSYNRGEDRAVWLPCKNGEYTVKSGYHMAREESRRKMKRGPDCSLLVPDMLWKQVWHLNVPPKIKHFLWRVINGALSTKEMLFRICRDSSGRLVGGMSRWIEASCPFMAECVALKEGFQVVERLGVVNYILELDCLELFNIMEGKKIKLCEWQCLDLVQELLSLKVAAGGSSLSLVSLQGNQAADC